MQTPQNVNSWCKNLFAKREKSNAPILKPIAAALLIAAAFMPPNTATAQSFTPSADFPHDVTDQAVAFPDVSFTDLALFSWQQFVALNYPADPNHRGQPLAGSSLGDSADARVWETYWHRVEVFPYNGMPVQSGGKAVVNGEPSYVYSPNALTLDAATFDTSSTGAMNNQLWNNLDEDSELNVDEMFGNVMTTADFTDENRIVYQAKMNEDGINYILANNLSNEATRDTVLAAGAADVMTYGATCDQAPAGQVSLPCGSNAGAEGYVEIKSAWRALSAAETSSGKFYTQGVIHYRGNEISGEIVNQWRVDTYGLIGLHIIHKTVNFPAFVFATFEHVDNIGDPANGTSTIGYIDEITQTGRGTGDTFGDKVIVTSRDNPIPAPVAAVNTIAHAAITGTVWENYQLVGVQAYPTDVSTVSATPATGSETNKTDQSSFFLANIVIETNEELQSFTGIQAADGKDMQNTFSQGTHLNMGGCMGCHGVAQSRGADFSFLLANAPFTAPEVVGGTGNITPFPINSYDDVLEMFNDYVADNPINIEGSPHKDFWNMGYTEFTTGMAPNTNIKIADCQTPSSTNSNIIAILRGMTPPTAPYNPGQMPEGGPYFPAEQIDNLAAWIDNGCVEMASAAGTINYGDSVGIFSTTQAVRLDIGTLAMKENVPANHNSWATQLEIRRLDGPSTGPVMSDHEVGIFSPTQPYRLDIGTRATKENVPETHRSWATVLEIRAANGTKTGPVQYGDLIGIFSTTQPYRLDIGTRATKEDVPASHSSWATVLKITPVPPM